MGANRRTIQTDSLYIAPSRKVALLNFSKRYYTNMYEMINSDELKTMVRIYLNSLHNSERNDSFEDQSADDYVSVIKKILVDDISAYDHYSRGEILDSIENFYTYYRSYLRVSVMDYSQNKIIGAKFREVDNFFNDQIRVLYRTIEEKLQGFPNKVYRQLDSGTNAAMLIDHHQWKMPAGYESLKEVPFIDRVMLRPPLMMHTKSNKREGVFSAVDYNPVDKFADQNGEWLCYPAKIGESLAFIYFDVDYLVNGLALSNLFQLASAKEIRDQKPDEIILFGLTPTEGDVSHYHHDADNDIWVAEVPYNDKTTYFGYMKKMCLTVHNLHQIYRGSLPIHGSMVKITFTNGKQRNVVFFGDSGAGKSESLEALQEVADDQIANLETIFDDMGSFTIDDHVKNGISAQGTEIGAFVRLDDLSSAVAFDNMDRGVYLNPERKNARVIIPADSWEHVVQHHHVDMWVYANNYDQAIGLHRFNDVEEAKKTFVAGKRMALGTTDEVGFSTTFFANPFGPVQEEERTKPIIDRVFKILFDHDVYVGEVYTHLGNDKSKDALHESAKELLHVLLTDD